MYNLANFPVFLIAFLGSFESLSQDALVAAEETLTAKDEFLLTHEQKKNFKILKDIVQEWMVVDYMKTDLYIVRRFRDKNFEVDKAVQAINETLQMRVEYGLDGIMNEDWTAYDAKWHQYMGPPDKKGRPVWYGKADQFYLAPELEAGNWRNSVEIFDKYEEKHKIARMIIIIDWHDVPILSLTCPLCGPFIKQFFKDSSHWPFCMYKSVNINVPPSVNKGMNVGMGAMTEEMKKTMVFFDFNAVVWKKYLVDLLGTEDKIPTNFYTGGVNPADPTGGDAEGFMKSANAAPMGYATEVVAGPAIMANAKGPKQFGAPPPAPF